MFKRFQPPKGLAPFPPTEEDITCPQCGFNHAGWAFETGYAKLCVKCGSVLEISEIPEHLEVKRDEGTGFFGKIFHGMFTKQTKAPAQGESNAAPEMIRPDIEVCPEPPGPQEAPPEVTVASPQQPRQAASAEGPLHEAEDGREYPDPCDAPPDPEAARVGACKREGRLLAAQSRYEEAIEMLQKVVAFEPNDLESWEELGRIHYQGTEDFAKSIACSRKALEIDGDLVRVKCNLCLALLFDGQFDLAKKGLLEVIRSVRRSRGCDEEFQENFRAPLQDCLGELVASKKKTSGAMHSHIKELIELLEIEQIYFH